MTGSDAISSVSVQTLPHLFAARVEASADDDAVITEDLSVSFRELDERSSRLARLLVSRGVGPEVPVALLLGQSVDFVVAVLAVVKAGGAYVPVDVGYPDARARVSAPGNAVGNVPR